MRRDMTSRKFLAQFPFVASVLIGLVFLGICSRGKCEELIATKSPDSIRIATYNVSLNRPTQGRLHADLSEGNEQANSVAAVIRLVRPDVILLNEVDYSEESSNAELFVKKYVQAAGVDKLGASAWELPYVYDASVNTGVPSGMDLNQNQKTSDPEDAWGYGRFPGQYGMAIASRFEIEESKVKTFQKLLWSQMPNALRPQAKGDSPYYDDTTWSKLRLSSKSFWDVPIKTPEGILHVLASHPTPPAFDGPEDRNGCRNHDEIRLIQDYIEAAEYIRDDNGNSAGLNKDDSFVVLGDLNSDALDGGSRPEAIVKLTAHKRIAAVSPTSKGAVEASEGQGGANRNHRGPSKTDTGDFNDRSVGNLRIDYVLPSSDFQVVASGVFWPSLNDVDPALREAVKECMAASDHHLVWVDIKLK